MKEYLKKILETSYEEVSSHSVVTEQYLRDNVGNLKDKELYDEAKNLEFLRSQEREYLERDYTPYEQQQLNNVGLFEKKKTVEKRIMDKRRDDFRKKLMLQSKATQDSSYSGNVEGYTTRLMLSLNYLSMQPFYNEIGISKTMQNTAGMLGDIAKFGEKFTETDPEFFKATLYTITTMFGYVTKNLREICDTVEKAFEIRKKDGEQRNQDEVKDVLGALKKGADEMGSTMIRLESRALDVQKSGNSVRWAELYATTKDSEVLTTSKDVEDTGAGSSVVYKIDRAGENVYFKGDEVVSDSRTLIYDVAFKDISEEVPDELKEFILQSNQSVVDFVSNIADVHGALEAFDTIDKMREEKKESEELLQRRLARATRSLDVSIELINDNLPDELQLKRETIIEIAKKHYKALNSYNVARGKVMLEEGADLSRRNFATEHLAFLFDADEVMVKSKDAILSSGNIQGFAMEEGKGIEYSKIVGMCSDERDKLGITDRKSGPKVVLTKEARDKFYKIQFLDILAGQVDRHGGNLMATHERTKEGLYVVKDIIAIDHDMSFGKVDNVYGSMVYRTGWVYDYCPRDLYENIMTVTPELLRINMANYIEPEYMESLVKRFELLKQELIKKHEKMKKDGKDFFSDPKDTVYLDASAYNVGH